MRLHSPPGSKQSIESLMTKEKEKSVHSYVTKRYAELVRMAAESEI